MPTPLRNLSSRVLLAALLYLIVTGILLSGSLTTLLNRLAETQTDDLGRALSYQLTETLKQPLINNDIISIQVVLDNLVDDTPTIARATVYSTANRILAQSQSVSPRDGNTTPFVSPISVDNNMLAQLRLELDEEVLFSKYQQPMWFAIGTWLLLSVALCYYLITLSRNYTARISTLYQAFGDTGEDNQSELAGLETALSPFISNNSGAADFASGSSKGFAMLAVSIPNLPKWQAQLNAEHFTGMLAKLDALIEDHISLFKGSRIHARSSTMLLQFEDNGDNHPLYRALNCGNALLQLANNLISNQNIPFDMRITAAYRHPQISGSVWYTDLVREEAIDRLLDILPLAGGWELIIDKGHLDDFGGLSDCELEDLSAASVWQFRSFSGQRQDAFCKQLEFLTAKHGESLTHTT